MMSFENNAFLSDQIEQSVILRVPSGAGFLYPVHLSGMVFIRVIPIYTNSLLDVVCPLDLLP